MPTATEWIEAKLASGDLTAHDIAELTEAFQMQNALKADAKPGKDTLGRARHLLDYYIVEVDESVPPTPPVPPPEGTDLPDLELAAVNWPEGIDISHHQRFDDPDALDVDLVQFAFVKATEGTSGSGSVDPQMEDHLRTLSDAGVEPLGVYHFARPSSAHIYGPTTGQPLGEAQNFARQWERAKAVAGGLLPPVLDIEDEKSQIPEPSALIDWCAEWCEHCRSLTGRVPIVYTYFSYIHVQLKGCVPTLGRYPLWLADYRGTPPDDQPREIPGWPWTIWQYTGSGSINGIAGAVDRNVFRGTNTQLLGLVR